MILPAGKIAIRNWLNNVSDDQFLDFWKQVPDDSYTKQMAKAMSMLQPGEPGENLWASGNPDEVAAQTGISLHTLRYTLAVYAHGLAEKMGIHRTKKK